jgi:hypothetical protein
VSVARRFLGAIAALGSARPSRVERQRDLDLLSALVRNFAR